MSFDPYKMETILEWGKEEKNKKGGGRHAKHYYVGKAIVIVYKPKHS